MEEAKSSGDLKQVQELTEKGVDMNEGHIMDEPSDVRRAPLSLAIKEGHEDLALELLSAGVDINVKDRDGRTALHWACEKGLEEVVEALKSLGSHVDERDMFGLTPVMLAADSSKTAIPLHLVRAGASCKGVSVDHMNTLFRHACCEAQSDLTAVQKLLEEGCSVGILSKEEQEELLLHACHKGDMLVVESLIGHGCTVSCVSVDGYTPLMLAAQEGHEDVVKMLILAGANVGMRDKCGNTALHYAADHTRLACGILLAEGGASVRTKNSSSQTPLDLASAEFRSAIKEALIFTARKSICVIGNAKSGKSTLIAALQAERNSLFGKIANRFRRVSDRRQRTAGIETVFHSSRRYGEVLFFDFAGQDDYHGPHRMFLESLLSKPGVSMTLLLVVKMTEEEDAILHQLHRWLSTVALMATPASPPHVIIIGSFLDKMNSQEEATALLARCIVAARRDLVELSPRIVGTSFLNCRQPQSTGINKICKFLQEIPIPEFRATHTRYSLAWVLSQIRSSFTAQAVQLKEFSKWLQDNKDNLPQTMPPPEEVCQDLMVVGHALYLPNREDPPKSWLVLDLPSILHDIYGTLFSQYREIVNKVGLLHYHHLAELFPCMDVGMVQQLLISLEFCLPVDPSILKVELSRLTQSKETSGWLFFPALISAKPPQSTLKGFSQQSVHYLCWQLRTSKKHSISARLLQTILFRLAAHFVVKQHNEDGVLQHCCSFWWNGITWQSTECTDISVHITNNRVIQVVGAGHTSADKLCQYLTNVINDILSTVHWLSPKLAAGAYIVYPPMIVTSPEAITAPPQERLFPMEGIHSSIRDHKEFALSLQDSENRCNTMPIADLFGGCSPSLEDIERISWPQPDHWSFTIGSGVRRVAKGISALTGSQMIPYGAQTLLDVSSTPDMPDVVKLVVTEVAADWQRVALRLGVEGWLSEAVLKSHPNDCEGACQDILDHWLRRDPHTGEEERTWSTLLIALGRAGFEELERSLRREHFHKTVC